MPKKPPSFKEKLILCLLAAGSLVFCGLLGEAAVRIAIPLGLIDYPNPDFSKIIHRFAGSYDLVYDLQPNDEGFDGLAVVKTNSLSMKDREYSAVKPPGTYRVAVLGDSVTFGSGIAVEDLYTEILEDRLKSDGRPIEVLNAAVTGYNSYQEEVALREKVIPLDPDMVVVGYCLNDNSATDGFKEIARQMHPDSIGSRMHSKFISLILDRLEEATGSWFKSFGGTKQLFQTLGRTQSERGIEAVVVIFPYNFKTLEEYKQRDRHKQIREMAEAEGIRVLDFLEVTQNLSAADREALYQPNDKAHFSAIGMKAVAKWLYDENRLIRPVGSSSKH